MIGSDGLPHDAFPHPRLWATFPRVLGHYSRELGLFPLEQAVHKMTGLTAQTFGLADRGVLRAGRVRRHHGVRSRDRGRGRHLREADRAVARHRHRDRQRQRSCGATASRPARARGRCCGGARGSGRLDHRTTRKAQALHESATGMWFLCVTFAPSRHCGSSMEVADATDSSRNRALPRARLRDPEVPAAGRAARDACGRRWTGCWRPTPMSRRKTSPIRTCCRPPPGRR